MAKKSYLKSTFNFLSEDDLKFLSKKIKLDLEKSSILIEEWADFFSVLEALSKDKVKKNEIKNLTPSFLLVKRIAENCARLDVPKSEKLYFTKNIQFFFMKMILGDASLKKISFSEPNLDRSFVMILSITIFKNDISEKVKDAVKSYNKEIEENIVKGFVSSDDPEAKKIGKNFELWKKCLNQTME